MPIYLTQRPTLQRDLMAEARNRRLRRERERRPRQDAGILQPPRKVGSSIVYAARVARTGGMTYLDGNGGSHVETRDPDELRRIVDQLVGKPVVLDHPSEGMVGPTTKIAGRVVNSYYEQGDPAHAVCDLEISDPEARRAIQDGVREISLGYVCDLDRNRQTSTRVDHVAVVPVGRCGPTCSLRADAHASCACGCGGACSSKRKDDNVQNSNYSAANADPQDLAHKSASGANAAPYSWTPIDGADRQEIQTRLQTFGAARFASDADREAARSDLLAAARRVGLDALARMYETQWASGAVAADPDTDEDAAQERARNRAADAYLGTGDVR